MNILCIGYTEYKNNIEYETTLKALRTIGINENFITLFWKKIYTGATARVHMDNQVSEKGSRP